MALQRVGIQFDFNANTKQAQANLNALEKTMSRIETRMRTMGAASDGQVSRPGGAGRLNTESDLRMFGETRVDLRDPIRQTEILSDNIRKGKMNWDDYGRAVKNNSAIATQQLAVQTGAIHSVQRAGQGFAATFTPNAMLRGVSGIELLTNRMTVLGEATKAVSQHTIDMGKNLAFSARQMTVSLTMPMAIMGGLAIKQFTDIDKQLTDIAKVYDANADGVEMSVGRIRQSMKELAMELSRTQGAEIEDTLNIAQFYAQQGKTGEVLKQSTVQASRLMMLGDVDINDAQKTITTLTSVVGASAEELGKYVDYLNKVEDSTQLTMSDFAKTLPTIAPLVKTFIPDDKDALMSASASMMEISRRAGFDPKESMNAWKSMYGSFVRPTVQTEKEFAELTSKYGQQLNLGDVVRSHEGDPVEILRELTKITEDWSLTDRGELMTRLTGKWQLSRGLGFMSALDESTPANEEALNRMRDINKELVNNPENLADNSKRQMDLIVNSAHNQMQRLKQDAQMMFADLGERIFLPVMDALGGVLDMAKGAYQALTNLPEPLKDIIAIGAQLTFIAGPILAAFAATKMLAGFAGRLAGSFASTAASAGRLGASMLGIGMKGSGKIESREQSIAKIQEKDSGMLNLEMQDALYLENKIRTETSALVDQKNAKMRESISLQRELNRSQTGTTTADGTPAKDPNKHLRQYQASLESLDRQWPMAISAGDIGPESFRKHAGRRGAPASRVAGIGLQDNKVFGSVASLRTDSRESTVPISMIHKTDSTSGGLGVEQRRVIRDELDKVNAGIAVRRSQGYRPTAEINADKAALEAIRGSTSSILEGDQPAGGRSRRSRTSQSIGAGADRRISQLEGRIANSRYESSGSVMGEKSYSIDELESQRASLLKAANGNHIQQAKVLSRLEAEQNLEADIRKKNNAAMSEEARNRSTRAQMMSAVKKVPGFVKHPMGTLETEFGRHDSVPLRDRVKNFGGDLKTSLKSGFRGDFAAVRAQEKAWSENTVRGGTGEYFRGHMTPRDIRNAQKSDTFKDIKNALETQSESADIAGLIEDNELMRRDYFDELKNTYKSQGYDDTVSHQAAQRDLEKSNLPTQAALQKETEQHMQRMVQRSDNLERRQAAIAENSGRWASNISNTATAFGVLGTMATSALGIQNSLVDGALVFANGIGAVGMLLPGIMEKAVGSFANFGSNLIDKLDASKLGTTLGSRLGDTMGTTLSSKLSGAFSAVGAGLMTAMPYIVGAAAALFAIKNIWDLHRKDSEAYVQSLKEANESAELHAELLGYVRNEQEDLSNMTYQEATDIRADRYRQDDTGRTAFISQMSEIDAQPFTGRIDDLTAILNKEAIRIIDDGGSDADVRSMVDAALKAAGVTDEVIVEGVQINFKNFQVGMDTAPGAIVEKQLREQMSGIGTARSWGDQQRDMFREVFTLSNYNPFEGENWTEYAGNAYDNLSGTAEGFVEGQIKDITAALNNASTDEERAKISQFYIDLMNDALADAEASGDDEKIQTSRRMGWEIMNGVLSGVKDDQGFAAALSTEVQEKLRHSEVMLQAVLGGSDQERFNSPEKASREYAAAIEELEGVHGELSIEEKKGIYNAVAYAGGLRQLGAEVKNSTDLLGRFHEVQRDVNGVDTSSLTAEQTIELFIKPDKAEMELRREQLKNVNEVLKNSPESFHKRFQFDIEVNDQESIDSAFQIMHQGMQAGSSYVADEAARQFQERQDATFAAIRAETDGAMKSMDAKQKASEKAFEARGKALNDQFKAEGKALDKQHKEEQKDFDKRRKEEDRAYQKQEKEQKKAFDKQQKQEKEVFDKSWDDRSDAIDNYYDSAIKAIEDQGKAEERLEQLRSRNAERERKRREYLANMANSNIDINVAIAGGNLDEAARIANSASAASADYYQDQIDTEAGYAAQDRGDARGQRVEALNDSRGYSMDEFGRLRDDASEGFADTQELAQEKMEEELQKDRDLYEEKKALEAEQFAERQELERERLQEEQERQREALAAEREAIQERHAAEREMIQETAKVKEDGARRHFEATQRSLDMELQALMSAIPTSLEEMEGWISDIESKYADHGIYLDKDFSPNVQDGMMSAVANAMAAANNKIKSDENWNNIGKEIGREMREGTLEGYTGEQIASRLLFGTPLGEPLNKPLDTKQRGGKYIPLVPEEAWGTGQSGNSLPGLYDNYIPGRAKGGPIFGPGTGTSDSILAKLSNGEHVLTAKEVEKAGGHSAVERLRKAIMSGKVPRFATGGGVGKSSSPSGSSELDVRVSSTGSGTVADGGVMSAVATDVSNMGTTFDQTMTNTVAPAWQMFGDTMVKVKKDSIDPVLEGSQIALAEYASQTNQIMSANMNPAWVQFGQNLERVKSTVWDVVMNEMKAGISSLSSSVSTAIGNEIMPKWTEGSNHIKTMYDTVINPIMQQTQQATTETAQNFSTAADMIGTGWGKVEENSAKPVRYTIGTVYNDGLVGMWNKVAEALDLDTMDRHEFSFATGGVLPGYTPGRDVHHFSSPTGGKLHLSGGEAIMRPEWTRAVGGPSAVSKMNADAKSGKIQSFHTGGVYEEGTLPKRGDRSYHEQRFAEGGVVDKPKAPAVAYGMPSGTNITYGAPGFPSWVYNMGSQFGLMASTYPGHQEDDRRGAGYAPNPQRQNRGIDWSGPIDRMQRFAEYLIVNGSGMPQLEQVIWMNPNTGQRLGWYGNAPASGGIYSSDWAGHQDHVHTRQSQSLDGTGSMDGVGLLGFAGGLGMTVDPKVIAAISKFNEEKSALKDKIKTHIEAGPDTIMKAIPGKVFSAFTAGMDNKIQAAMPLMTGATMGAYGLNHEDHVKEIIAAAHEKGLPREAAKIAVATALVESNLKMYANTAVPESLKFPHEALGSDHDSVGLFQQRDNGAWGTVAQRMNARASAHLFYNRLMQFDWRSMSPGDAAQKVQVSAYPDKYATRMGEANSLIDMVGGFEGNISGAGPADGNDGQPKDTFKGGGNDWFDQGGVASGTGLMNKAVISPERVLSPRQTQAFEQMVPAINRVAEGGLTESHYMAKHTNFDRDAAFRKMIERNSEAEIDFTEILEKMTPLLTQLVSGLKAQIVPGITGYATDLIKLENDSQRIDKIATDIVNALDAVQVPEINTDMQFNVGGNIYGDAQLNAILEQWKRQTILEVQTQQALAQQAIGGK